MKNRRPVKNREIVLLYRFRDTEIGRQLHGVAARMGILCKVVEENQTEDTLGALLKLPGFAAETNRAEDGKSESAESEDTASKNRETESGQAALTRQVMVMHGFTRGRLEEFLQNMRKAGMPIIPLKAIVTPQNVNWTFRSLYEELEKEDEAMRKRREQKAAPAE